MGNFNEGGDLPLKMYRNRIYSRAVFDFKENAAKDMKTFHNSMVETLLVGIVDWEDRNQYRIVKEAFFIEEVIHTHTHMNIHLYRHDSGVRQWLV